MKMPTVCAIILDYFGSGKTMTCLTSLIDQGLNAVMIVDNSGDQQANLQLQESLAEFTKQEVPFEIHKIVNPQNLGYAAGINNALRWLETHDPHDYYLLINNDAEAIPDMLQHLLQFMRTQDRTSITAPVIDIGQKQFMYSWYHRFSGLMFSHHVFGAFRYLTGCCLLVDRRIVKNGLFDEDFFMYGEDVELSWRLQRSGWEAACVNQAVVRHEGTGSSTQGGIFYEYNVIRGHLLLAKKLARHQWEIPILYFGRLMAISIRSIVRSIRFRSSVPIRAWISVLRNKLLTQ